MKVWKCRASFYSANDDLLDKQTIKVKGDGIPCFKIPKGAACVFIKVEEEPEYTSPTKSLEERVEAVEIRLSELENRLKQLELRMMEGEIP